MKMTSKNKKKNFTSLEIKVLSSENNRKKSVTFGSISSGIKEHTEAKEWEKKINHALNALPPLCCTVIEIKKKWFEKWPPKKMLPWQGE